MSCEHVTDRNISVSELLPGHLAGFIVTLSMIDLGCPSQYRESATSTMRELRVDVSHFHVISRMAPSCTRSKTWWRSETIGEAGIDEVWLFDILVLLLCSIDRVCLATVRR